MTSPTPAVRVTDLHVALGGFPIVHGVSFDVAPGEILTLMGGNGSGKTTMVRAILGIIPILSGRIEIGGVPAADAPRERLGYVPQRVSAAGGVSASALEVVTSGLLHDRRLVPPRGGRARALEALHAVGLADLSHQDVSTLSGGQQQRVLIARAMARRPDLLILDEPLAGVDLPSQEVFAQVLTHIKEQGATVVIVLHEVGPLAKLIDRAVVLERGKAVHVGKPPHAHGEHALPGHVHIHPHDDDPTRAADGQPTLGLKV
ncbi:MAG: ATP-binding cassette domain-containing protein [Demequinaceae bacterium]|nr:ATP-binding cassette domain-containing protein [Demequinaceae bacterium]